MASTMRQQREIEATASSAFARVFFTAFGVAALLGLALGIVWIIWGLVAFHGLR